MDGFKSENTANIQRHCEERSDEAIQRLFLRYWIAKLLSVTRNDAQKTIMPSRPPACEHGDYEKDQRTNNIIQ